MKEKVLITSYCPDTTKFFKIMAIVGLVLAMLVFMVQCSSGMDTYNSCKETYDMHQAAGSCGWSYYYYGTCWECEYVEEHSPVGDAIPTTIITFVAVMVIGVIVKLLLSSFSLTVTDKRVYCKTLWIYHTSIPVDSITAVGRVGGIFNGLSITAPSRHIIVSFVVNSKKIYEVLNDLLVERQQKNAVVTDDSFAFKGE